MLRIGSTVGIVGAAGCVGASSSDSGDPDEQSSVTSARQFSSPGCSCCEQYAIYLRGNMIGDLSETVPDDIQAVKQKHGIPTNLWSCHTVVLDDYVVEGHVPMGAIETLLEEQPVIDGIALPGMPAGSPGMGGAKNAPFTIYAIGGGKSGTEFVEV